MVTVTMVGAATISLTKYMNLGLIISLSSLAAIVGGILTVVALQKLKEPTCKHEWDYPVFETADRSCAIRYKICRRLCKEQAKGQEEIVKRPYPTRLTMIHNPNWPDAPRSKSA